jgi:predicted RNA-binding Zn-ribbon protein involved in translation (DUF1610 family)
MARLYTCDNCGNTFPQAIEEEVYKDEHGILRTLDLCAPCKNLLKVEQSGIKFIKKIKAK